jgi:orotidine-5'-phosphate decarboxylase
VGLIKVGSQLFTAEGPRAVKVLAALGLGLFVDLKFHDIPNTVARAVAATAELPNVRLLTVHTLGGTAMMQAARRAVGAVKSRPKLLGVTILTSMDEAALRSVGIAGPPAERVVALAKLAQEAGLDGVVASGQEARAIRTACGPKFLIVVPGVRPAEGSAGDQSRVTTPAEAILAGADYLVVGRPITEAEEPPAVALAIAREIASARRR